MKFGKIAPEKEKFITLDDLSGGVDETAAGKARLVSAQNVNIKGKTLISRKGLKTAGGVLYEPEAYSFANTEDFTPTVFYNGEYKRIVVIRDTDDASYVKYSFKMLGNGSASTDLGNIRFSLTSSGEFAEPLSVFVFTGNATCGEGIYAFFSFVEDPVNMQGYYMKMYEYTSSGRWQILNEDDIYAPVVYKNGRGVNYALSEKKFPEPQYPEKPNMLSTRTRFYFNADGASSIFFLPIEELKRESNAYIKCSVTLGNGNKLDFTISGTASYSNIVFYEGTSAQLTVDRANKKLQFSNFMPPYVSNAENTIEVTVCQSNEENVKKIANMKCSIWYNANNSGACLCAAGNRLYPSLLIISNPNNALYFPQDNQFYIGDPSQRITALAKQNKSLVVFKEKEIYCGAYSSGKFSVTHLHSEIGCDLPKSVALCGNRVVWANTNKCIYTLNALSDYGAVAVYRISSAVEDTLAAKDFSRAAAAYYDDVYYLFLNNEVCVMNVAGALLQSNKQFLDSAAFTFWKLPEDINIQFAFGVKTGIRILCETHNSYGQILYCCDVSGETFADEVMYKTSGGTKVNRVPFYSILEFLNTPGNTADTRSFYKAYISCYAENGLDIEYLNDTGDIRKTARIDMKYTHLRFPAPYRLMPIIASANLLVKMQTSGEFTFSGYTLYYRDFI